MLRCRLLFARSSIFLELYCALLTLPIPFSLSFWQRCGSCDGQYCSILLWQSSPCIYLCIYVCICRLFVFFALLLIWTSVLEYEAVRCFIWLKGFPLHRADAVFEVFDFYSYLQMYMLWICSARARVCLCYHYCFYSAVLVQLWYSVYSSDVSPRGSVASLIAFLSFFL